MHIVFSSILSMESTKKKSAFHVRITDHGFGKLKSMGQVWLTTCLYMADGLKVVFTHFQVAKNLKKSYILGHMKIR